MSRVSVQRVNLLFNTNNDFTKFSAFISIVAQIFHDLDGGFKPINFLFEDLPLPSNKLRDQAHVKMRNFFMDIMKDRREKGITDRTDIMQYLTTNCQYKNGNKLS